MTFSAHGPFGPRPSVYSTDWPSRRLSKLPSKTAELWKKTSPRSPSMNPNPFSVSFLIVPCDTSYISLHAERNTCGPTAVQYGWGPLSTAPRWNSHRRKTRGANMAQPLENRRCFVHRPIAGADERGTPKTCMTWYSRVGKLRQSISRRLAFLIVFLLYEVLSLNVGESLHEFHYCLGL